ncbi:alpha/beta fold hydrolase [Cellulomonas sp. Leaf334]|uniref:alpha/beta fold hydrolase n=1 Tax=Cellulomonas sp. Leaf334 TaxID=1736339 RepID=UPI0006F7807D|nr:alpha/beta hydrolase [Cellulomonas sp. Leaf334]KQR12244.1 alpha/beta hydrolase [Cellulomonas sp. Leaf334]
MTSYLSRPGGRIAYSLDGPADGPLVVLVPGMGDVRSTWRELVGPLVDAGHRVAVTDLRGHGDSDTTFATHGDVMTGQDALALVEHLGGPAVLVGNSMGAGAAAWAAAERPDLVAGLVLTGPFLRDPAMPAVVAAGMHQLMRALFARPWGGAVWASYYKGYLNRGHKAPWLDEHVADLRAAMKDPAHLRSFRHLAAGLTHAPVEARLAEVSAPAIAFVGAVDPDYSDPAAEAQWIRDALRAEVTVVPDAGHYPHHQAPAVVVPATLTFLAGLPRDPAGRFGARTSDRA